MKILGAAAVALAVPTLGAAPAAAQEDARPNVVVMMTDDQTHASLRFMPGVRGLLQRQGTSFERAFATFPLCCPSRATYLTGQYAHNHGVIHNAGPFGGHTRLDHSNTLPVWLQAAGYRTIQLGRYLNGYGSSTPETDIPPGWSDWHASLDPSTFDYERWRMNENGRVVERSGEHQTDFYGRRAAELIERAAQSPQPFFLSLTFAAPHSGRPRDPDDPSEINTPSPSPRHRDAFASVPLPRPPSFDEQDVSDKPQLVFDRPRLTPELVAAVQENYQQELESLQDVDDAVSRVYAALERSGELDDTLIVYTSDNGFMHGEHRFQTEKVLPYEPAVRVPFVLRGPGVPRGRRERRLVANVDLAPTILDAARALPGRLQDGRSLFRLLRDRGLEWGRDVLLENGRGANGVPSYRAIRTYRFLYVEHLTTGEYELYDMRRDPHQLDNVSETAAYEHVELELARRVRRLARCRGAGCRARPALRLLLRGPTRPARRGRRCLSGDLRVRLRGGDVRLVQALDVLVGRRRLARDRRAPFVQAVPARRLRRGRELRVRARATTRDGRVLTLDRRLLTCRQAVAG